MSVIFLTLPLLWAQVNPATPGTAPTPAPAVAQAGAPATKAAQAGAPATKGAAAPGGAPGAAAPGAAARAPALPPMDPKLMVRLIWAYFLSDPLTGGRDFLAASLTWLKSVGLICLIGWLFSWLITGIKERVVGRGEWFDYVGIVALILTPTTVMVQVLQTMNRMAPHPIGPVPLVTALGLACVLLYAVWIEFALWRTIRRMGDRFDRFVLAVLHVALAAGLGVGLWMQQQGYLTPILVMIGLYPWNGPDLNWRDALFVGARMGLTYMGYVVLIRVAGQFLVEVFHGRFRRLYAIARLSVYEATRRMWAPWVVLTVFLLVLAFTHWFLQPPRAAEMGRLYVGTLMLLCSALLTVMVTVLTPLSLPTDIQQQTIYTVVSKPVRRLEMIWGRMIGYMALVTVLLVVFGGISLLYLKRTVGATIDQTQAALDKAEKEGRQADAKLLREQWEQLYTRMQAREPVKGSLSFLDSRGVPHAVGIDVGQDVSTREPRSHIEGATPSAAIWSFGNVPDPFTPPGQQPRILPRVIPVDLFLTPGTVESTLDRLYQLQAQIRTAQESKNRLNLSPAESARLDQAIARNQQEFERVRSEYDARKRQVDDLEAKRAEADAAGRKDEAEARQKDLDRLHSSPITVEMTFNVYRTTKGKIGEPVYAEITATNPYTGYKFEGDIFAIREYYTNKVYLPAEALAGSRGALKVEIRCLSPTQYLGMAESDLFLLPHSGSFGVNYAKGLFGIWLQAMVLTAIGVFAGTFLSWPVALLTTIFFFVAGQLAFSFLVDFTRQAIMGGGPFESLIRLLTHDNQMSELAPTASVILAKTLDSLFMPLMSMLVFVVPNFNALDVSNLVADGFAVTWGTLLTNTLLALGYALPFSVAGYYILKKREVAA
jgi:ABC-type transport system involved in multi-copper enzyme maturation permease subunit